MTLVLMSQHQCAAHVAPCAAAGSTHTTAVETSRLLLTAALLPEP